MIAVLSKSIIVSRSVRFLALLSLWLVFCALGAGSVYADTVVVSHVVQSGDNLTSIARQYGTTVSRITAENHISAQATLRVGQVLSITRTESAAPAAAPTATPQPAAPPPTASPAGSDPAPARESDGPTPTNQPAATATPPPAATPVPPPQSCAGYAQPGEMRYTVHGGDTLSGLATKYNTTVTAIMSRNCLRSQSLMVGQLLIVPIGGGSSPATPTPTSTGQGTDPTPTRAPATATPTRWPTATPRPPNPTPVPAPTATPSGSWLDRLLGRGG